MDIEKQPETETETAILLEADSETLAGPNSGEIGAIPVTPGNTALYTLSTFAAPGIACFAYALIMIRFPQTTTVLRGFLFVLCFWVAQCSLIYALRYAYYRGLYEHRRGKQVPRSRCELGRLGKSAYFLISIATALLARRYLVDQHQLGFEFILGAFTVSLTIYAHTMIRLVCCMFLDLCLRDLLVAALMQILAQQFSKTHAFICGAILLHDFCFYKPVPDIFMEERIDAVVLRFMDYIQPSY